MHPAADARGVTGADLAHFGGGIYRLGLAGGGHRNPAGPDGGVGAGGVCIKGSLCPVAMAGAGGIGGGPRADAGNRLAHEPGHPASYPPCHVARGNVDSPIIMIPTDFPLESQVVQNQHSTLTAFGLSAIFPCPACWRLFFRPPSEARRPQSRRRKTQNTCSKPAAPAS